jgi:hypothetical protein
LLYLRRARLEQLDAPPASARGILSRVKERPTGGKEIIEAIGKSIDVLIVASRIEMLEQILANDH